jgi:two-component system phosphate regulon sensor histidine kinase PhoR
MPVTEPDNNPVGTSGVVLEAWIPTIIPALKSRWAKVAASAPAYGPIPNLSDWLTLFHLAATAPWKIADQLAHLLNHPKSGLERHNSWLLLTRLLALTFEAAQAESSQLDPTAWPSLLEIQSRILGQAAQVTLARENRPDTATLTRRALYLQAVAELSKRFTDTWDPDELLDGVVLIIQQVFGYEYVNLFRLNQAKQLLLLQAAIWQTRHPKPSERHSLLVGAECVVGRVAATGQTILVDDVSRDSNYLPYEALPNLKSQLAVPLIVGSNLVGVLDIASDQPEAFDQDDRQIAEALAGHVAVAIENARLQSALQRHLHEKTLLYESNIALGTSLEKETVLQLMTQKIAEALTAGACVICQIDEQAGTITALAEYVFRYPGNPAHTWRKLNATTQLAKDQLGQQVLKTNRPLIDRADAQKSAVWALGHGPVKGPAEPKQSWGIVLALPLEAEDQIIGLVEVYDKNPTRTFSTDDIQLCRILATQTTLALERARLFNETRQRLNEVATLYTLAQEISGKLDLQAVLDSIAVSLRKVMGCRGCCIFLIDQTGEQLEIKAADGLKPHWRKMAKLKLGEGAAGQAAAKGQTVYIPDTKQDPSFIFFDEEVRSLMVTPLVANGEVIGTINVDDRQPYSFGRTQERLLTITAAQAGIVIENARLFTRISAERQQIQAIIQHMADGLLLINSQGIIIKCNHTLAVMLGLSTGEIVGQSTKSSSLHPNLANITAHTTHMARTGVLSKEVIINTPRSRTLQVFSTPVIDDDRNQIGEVRVVHDITKERELEQLKADFISTISHELRTPLFSIHGFAEVLLEEDELDPATRTEFLATIKRQAAQLSEMVNNLLDLSKFDEGRLDFEREPVAMIDLINQTILKLQGYAHERKVTLRSKLPGLLPIIIGDKFRLEQVLTNLIGNAIKFSDTNGQVLVSAVPGNGEILIEVEDNGIGIPQEDFDQIFSRYYQAEHKSERSAMGSGLGLHIAQKIVEGHSGRIWAESTTGQGSTFRFSLPVPKAPPTASK